MTSSTSTLRCAPTRSRTAAAVVGRRRCRATRAARCAALATAAALRELRKTVTVLFCDVTGSTALGDSTDPEALRALLARYFERMKTVVARRYVEKFIGDAVMAVFGRARDRPGLEPRRVGRRIEDRFGNARPDRASLRR